MKKIGKILTLLAAGALSATLFGSCAQMEKVLETYTPAESPKTMYEIAVENGFMGTVEDWLASLVGPQGETGAAGADGANGAAGEQGLQGIQGESGVSIVDVEVSVTVDEDGQELMTFVFKFSDGTKKTVTTMKQTKVTVSAVEGTQGIIDAVANGADTVELGEGTYDMPAIQNKKFMLTGTKDTIINLKTEVYTDGSTITFKGVTLKGRNGNSNGSWYTHQLVRSKQIIFEDCVITDSITTYGNSIFRNCTFHTDVYDYSVYLYSGTEHFIENCTFNSNGKMLKLYSENTALTSNVTVKGCTFNSDNAEVKKAGIEIDSTFSTYYVNIENCTVDNNKVVKVWNSDAGKDANTYVTIDGVAVNV